MKKLLIALMCFLALFMASCSNDGKKPGEGGAKPTGPERNMFSLDTTKIKSIATTDVALNGKVATRAITSEGELPDETLLVYCDENDNLAPLVFKNADGRHVTFTVEKSYSLDDSTFAIDFDKMLVSTEPPEFLVENGKDPATSDSTKTPIVEDFPGLRTYHFDGQLIISIADGKASFLTAVDLAKFQGQTDLYYDSWHAPLWFDLKNAFVYDGNVYLTTLGTQNKMLYKISLTRPTEAVPLSNIEGFSVDFILSAAKDGLLVEGREGVRAGGKYIMSHDGRTWPEPVGKGYKVDVTTDEGYGFILENVGSFKNDKDLLLGDNWWNISASDYVNNFYKLKSTGEPFMHPLANGFFYNGEEIKKEWIEEIDGDYITFNGNDPMEIKVDSGNKDPKLNGTLYTMGTEHNPIVKNGKQLKDYRKILKEGFYVGEKLIKDARIAWNYYDYKGTRYPIGTDSDGDICVMERKCYPTINGYRVADIKRLGGAIFELDGKTYNPVGGDSFAYSDRNVVINGKSYMMYEDEYRYKYFMMPDANPEKIKDQYGAPIHDDRFELIGTFTAGKLGELTGVKFMPDPMRLECTDGETYYLNSNSSEFLSISFLVKVPFTDASGNPINGIKKTIQTEGLTYYDGTLVELSGYGDTWMQPATSATRLTLELAEDGKIFTMDTHSNVFAASRIDIDSDLKPVAGPTVAVRVADMTGSTKDWVLMNVADKGAGVFVLYYYQASSTSKGNLIYKIELDTNGFGSMRLLETVSLGTTALPPYVYSTNRNRFWTYNYKHIVFGDGGSTIYWLDTAEKSLNMCNMDTGLTDSVQFENKFAGATLTKIGSNLVFNQAPNGTRVNTYILNTRDLHAEPTLFSTSDMAVVPLWDLSASDF